MKKTLIALMTLAGVASANVYDVPTVSTDGFYAGNYVFNFTITEANVNYDENGVITSLEGSPVLTYYYVTITNTDSPHANAFVLGVQDGAITLSVGRGGLADSWANNTYVIKADTTFTFYVQNSSDVVSSGTFSTVSSDSHTTTPVTLQVGQSYTITNTVTAGATNNQTVQLWITGSDTALASVTYTGNMNVGGTGNANPMIVVCNSAYTIIPEPATATLSLLALAALAARRRM